MVAVRSVPHQTGSRYTFGVKRFGARHRPGWKVVRVAGTFWHLPPDTLKYVTPEQILQFLKAADSSQRASFLDGIACRDSGKTRDATGRGIYWTGQHAFQVGMPDVECVVTPFNGEYRGDHFTGIYVDFPEQPELNYYLSVNKDVTIATFYKYLLFYGRYVRVSPVQDDWHYKYPLPYGRDRRLEGCSIENFNNSPQHSLAVM
ncbi:hypothetical protein MLDJOKPK_00062 [Salmonella phage SPAsTU]|nr:hypothetical protein STsAS_078 [Salmonella phage STsAS]AXF51078.1 hypothetical protein MLDJOKPK_00062 [Salmonella phage SPAsTU]